MSFEDGLQHRAELAGPGYGGGERLALSLEIWAHGAVLSSKLPVHPAENGPPAGMLNGF